MCHWIDSTSNEKQNSWPDIQQGTYPCPLINIIGHLLAGYCAAHVLFRTCPVRRIVPERHFLSSSEWTLIVLGAPWADPTLVDNWLLAFPHRLPIDLRPLPSGISSNVTDNSTKWNPVFAVFGRFLAFVVRLYQLTYTCLNNDNKIGKFTIKHVSTEAYYAKCVF